MPPKWRIISQDKNHPQYKKGWYQEQQKKALQTRIDALKNRRPQKPYDFRTNKQKLDIGDIYNDVNFMEGVRPYEPSEEDQGFEVKPRPRIVRKLQPMPKYVTPQVTWDADDLDLILYTPDFNRLLQNSLPLTNRAARMYKGYRITPIDTNGQTSRVGIKNTKGPTNPRDVYETFDMFKIQKVIKNGKQYTDPRVLDYLYNKTQKFGYK